MKKPVKITVRGYGGGRLIFEETVSISKAGDLEETANRHLALLLPHAVHMLEIEFLDEPNPLERYLRFGTDPKLMVSPQKIHPWN